MDFLCAGARWNVALSEIVEHFTERVSDVVRLATGRTACVVWCRNARSKGQRFFLLTLSRTSTLAAMELKMFSNKKKRSDTTLGAGDYEVS